MRYVIIRENMLQRGTIPKGIRLLDEPDWCMMNIGTYTTERRINTRINMYELFEKIMLIYSIVMIVCIIIFPFTIEKGKLDFSEAEKDSNLGKTEDRWKKTIENTILLLTVGIYIVGFIWLIRHKEYSWILIPVTLLTFLERIEEASVSMGIIKKTLNSKGNEL